MSKLYSFAQNISIPWVIIGNFNKITLPNKKAGGAPVNMNKYSNFRDWIEDCRLFDMGFSRPAFTWRGQESNGYRRVIKRLDIAMCTIDWRVRFFETTVVHLPHIRSNHHPILLKVTKQNICS